MYVPLLVGTNAMSGNLNSQSVTARANNDRDKNIY